MIGARTPCARMAGHVVPCDKMEEEEGDHGTPADRQGIQARPRHGKPKKEERKHEQRQLRFLP